MYVETCIAEDDVSKQRESKCEREVEADGEIAAERVEEGYCGCGWTGRPGCKERK